MVFEAAYKFFGVKQNIATGLLYISDLCNAFQIVLKIKLVYHIYKTPFITKVPAHCMLAVRILTLYNDIQLNKIDVTKIYLQ